MSSNKIKTQELYYDNGNTEKAFKAQTDSIGANKFVTPNERKIYKVKTCVEGETTKIHILDENFQSIFSKKVIPRPDLSWVVDDISSFNVRVSGEFFVGVEWLNENFWLGLDKTPPYANKSYLGKIGNSGLPKQEENYMIRVFIGEPYLYDAFISHASEDKESFVRPLADALVEKGLRVWFDDFTLTLGDSLRRSIDKGLLNSHYGIIVLSKHFFKKEWTQKELDGLVSKEDGKGKIILPIWHGVSKEEVKSYSPILADRKAVLSSKGLQYVVQEIMRVISASNM